MDNEEHESLDMKKKFIIDKIKFFNKLEEIEVLKILKKEKIKYSENNNGIFINLNILEATIIDIIYQFVKYCIVKKKKLQKDSKQRDTFKNLLNNNNSKIDNLKKNKQIVNNNNSTNNFMFNEELDIDQNDMYYQDSYFKLPELNIN